MYRVRYQLEEKGKFFTWGNYKRRGWAFKVARSLEKQNFRVGEIRVEEMIGMNWYEIVEAEAYNV